MNFKGLAWCCSLVFTGLSLPSDCQAQTPQPGAAPPAIKLAQALTRARQYAGQIQSANLAVLQAHEDAVQARAARLPSLSALNQFLYTEGNGTPSGVYVANDGVHVYNEQAVLHQELLAVTRNGEVRRASAAEALARAKVEVAARGLDATVVGDYYGVVSAQRHFANAQTSLQEAERFVAITRDLEKGGESAHADVVKAQIDLEQRRRDLREAEAAIEKAKIALGVLIFPDFSSNFEVVDDLNPAATLPELAEARSQATASNPDLKSAQASLLESGYDIGVARYGYLPSLSVDFFYGIDANQFAVRTDYATQATGRSTLPDYELNGRKNLGYSAAITLNVPLWNWGATHSKVKQAEEKREQAQLDLALTRRTLSSAVASMYAEARAAQSQLDSLRSSVDLAAESLRLTVLRYQAGEAVALEVSDAQATVTTARNAYDDGLARYRVALDNLKILTGTL
ncbi:MAG: TolC family protein [Bryobacteraceae bacterium]|jgi:outer membrane protein TolC